MKYKLGGHIISIDAAEKWLNNVLPSFRPFLVKDVHEDKELLLQLTITDEWSPINDIHTIRDVDTGNGMIRVDKTKNGGYQFLVRNINGEECALLKTSEMFNHCTVSLKGNLATIRFALNNTLMLAYAFASAHHNTLLIHASVVRYKGKAYAFTAKSGTGKSTQVANWLSNIEGCDLVNDDNPIIRMEDGKPFLYGSPWSGKTPCYRNIKSELGGIILIKRDNHNEMISQQPIVAFTTILTACSAMKWDVELYQSICKLCSQFVENTQVTELHCLPDADSAITACNYLTK